jgi:hypothetical protein
MTDKKTDALKLAQRITDYLAGGGLFNPELADHGAVRDLLIDCREALADSALDRMAENARELGLDYEPAQQQVIEHASCQGMNCGITRTDQEHSMECQAEHAAAIAGGAFVKPAQQQEPVATVTSETGADISMSWWHEPALPVGIKLYTSPQPSKPWVGLTPAEAGALWKVGMTPHEFSCAIEAKLREKNNG